MGRASSRSSESQLPSYYSVTSAIASISLVATPEDVRSQPVLSLQIRKGGPTLLEKYRCLPQMLYIDFDPVTPVHPDRLDQASEQHELTGTQATSTAV